MTPAWDLDIPPRVTRITVILGACPSGEDIPARAGRLSGSYKCSKLRWWLIGQSIGSIAAMA
jgi:hypothetical protein